MKKLATLILAAGLVFGAATGASAIDFKAKGNWVMSFDYGQNGAFEGKDAAGNKITGWGKGGQDEFEAGQRVRLQLDAVASESLSGTVYFEIGKQVWGKGGTSNSGGAALGADSTNVIKVKNAYLDWMVPETDVKVRMGIQGITTPAYASGFSVFNDDMAGITVSAAINENVGLTAFWARPYNDNYVAANSAQNAYMDNFDAFALLVPLTFDGVKVTPWGMYAAIGPNTFANSTSQFGNLSNMGVSSSVVTNGLLPVGGSRDKNFNPVAKNLSGYANAVWAGISGQISMFDPLSISFDFDYGSVSWDSNSRLNRQGWFLTLLAEYKLDWAIPGLYGWYASGDDSNPSNGSERMPSLYGNNSQKYSMFAFEGDPWIARDSVIGTQMSGTWGIGGRLKDMSFLENIKHTFRINYIGGTNSLGMAKKLSRAGYWANGTGIDGGASVSGINGVYMTTGDSALEFGLTNTYKPYDNLSIIVEADYVALWLDTGSSAWGANGTGLPSEKDAWNINASFVYAF